MSGKIQLQEAFKLALSMMLFYWLALWNDWDLPKYGALAIVIISLSTTGASLNKGFMRVAGTGLGALAGFVLLSWFSQSPLGMLLATAVYLVFTGYFLQTSRQGDIWFNAGFLAVAVWSSSYMKVDTAFDFAMTRFLETAAGVLLLSIVSALIWPRTSGAALQQLGQSVWTGLHELYLACQQQLATGKEPDESADLRTRLAGDYQQLLATIEAAYSDTPIVNLNKKAWEVLRVNLRLFANAQALWLESIKGCRDLELAALLPGLGATLDTLEQRLVRGRQLWDEQKTAEVEESGSDANLLQPVDLQVDKQARAKLSRIQQATLMNFVGQLTTLDRTSRELLQTLRVLAGMEPPGTLDSYRSSDPFRPSLWNPERLLKALFPALCWITGYAFWYFVNPPGGPAIPMMCAAFGLMMVMAPVPLVGLLLVLLLSMFIAVAPVYFFIMPALDNGFGLLALIFIYTFIFGYLGGRSPVLKLGPIAMFVMMVDINNQQVYSFMALAMAGLVMILGVSIVLLVQRLLSPMHPEHIMLRGVQRFLRGTANIIDRYQPRTARQQRRNRRHRKRNFENTILPVSAQLFKLEKSLDYSLFPDNTPDKVQQLVDSLQVVRLRLLSLEATYTVAESRLGELMHDLSGMGDTWRQRLVDILTRWSHLDLAGNDIQVWSEQSAFARDMEQRLERLLQAEELDKSDQQSLHSLFAFVGSTQVLLDALKELDDSMQQLNWGQWSAARF